MQSPHSATPKNIVCKLCECIRQNHFEGFADLVSALHIARSNGRNGPDVFVAGAANLHRAYSDFNISIEAMVAEGDTVAVRWREKGVHRPLHQLSSDRKAVRGLRSQFLSGAERHDRRVPDRRGAQDCPRTARRAGGARG